MPILGVVHDKFRSFSEPQKNTIEKHMLTKQKIQVTVSIVKFLGPNKELLKECILQTNVDFEESVKNIKTELARTNGHLNETDITFGVSDTTTFTTDVIFEITKTTMVKE